MMLAPTLSSPFLRYFCVVVGGLVIDLGLAWTLANLAGVPLVLAAATGFSVGAVVCYFLHEFWTFRAEDSRLSLKRAGLYIVTMATTLSARLSIVALLAPLGSGHVRSLAVLIAAVGVSFVVNYLVSRFVIYRR